MLSSGKVPPGGRNWKIQPDANDDEREEFIRLKYYLKRFGRSNDAVAQEVDKDTVYKAIISGDMETLLQAHEAGFDFTETYSRETMRNYLLVAAAHGQVPAAVFIAQNTTKKQFLEGADGKTAVDWMPSLEPFLGAPPRPPTKGTLTTSMEATKPKKPQREGAMKKLSKRILWNKRYFALHGSTLSYFKNEQDFKGTKTKASPQSKSINVKRCLIDKGDEDYPNYWTIKITQPVPGTKTTYLQCATKMLRDDWFNILTRAANWDDLAASSRASSRDDDE